MASSKSLLENFSQKIEIACAINLAPESPGAYRFWDKDNQVIYVGKANNIRSRIRSHISDRDTSARHHLMIDRSRYLDWILVPNETEALILEDSLIKRYRPDFNIRFRDDKHYPILRLSIQENYPNLTVVRRVSKDGALYFGPYVSSKSMRLLLRLVQKYFQIRRCHGDPKPKSECLNFQMHRCSGVCVSRITRAQYGEVVKKVRLLLSGRNDELIEILKGKMISASSNLNFEEAALLRDQFKAVASISKSRRLLLSKPVDMDVFGIAKNNDLAFIEIVYIRAGFISGNSQIVCEFPLESTLGEILERSLLKHYIFGAPVPPEILLSHPVVISKETLAFFKNISSKQPFFHFPKKGIKAKLIALSITNAENRLNSYIKSNHPIDSEIADLQRALNLQALPSRIEAIDISESAGRNAVGAVVAFRDGKPDKYYYRRFKIKHPENKDDTHRIEEVMRRRLRRLDDDKWALPDLFLIDGGRNQLNAALSIISERKLTVPVISIAKIRNHRTIEGIFSANEREINLPNSSPALKLLGKMRDEAHRYAIQYHRSLRKQMTFMGLFSKLHGVPKKIKTVLLQNFKTLNNIKAASIDDFKKTSGIGPHFAKLIFEYIQQLPNQIEPD